MIIIVDRIEKTFSGNLQNSNENEYQLLLSYESFKTRLTRAL